MKFSKPLLSALAATLVTLPSLSLADSQLGIGVGASASADLDFRIVIPDFVYFQVGTFGTTPQDDIVEFDLGAAPPVRPGSGTDVTATAGGAGDGVDGALSITLATNSATVTISATALILSDGGALTIPSSEILTASTGTIQMPAFGANTGSFAPGLATLNDTWTYTYDNSAVYAAATYTGRVVYTVSTP